MQSFVQLTSFYGFGFYFCSSLFAALVVYICNVGLTPRKYFKNGFVETATQGLLGNMMSFTLCMSDTRRLMTRSDEAHPVWTMFYGLVHIFEA